MSVTILECLQSANYNLKYGSAFSLPFAKTQLNNAVVLLEKNYSLWEKVEPLLEMYINVENVPEKEIEK